MWFYTHTHTHTHTHTYTYTHISILSQKMHLLELLLWLRGLRTWLLSTRLQVPSLALLSGLGIQCCPKLWYRLQMWFGSQVAMAVAQAGSCSSDLTPSLRISIWPWVATLKRQKAIITTKNPGVPAVVQQDWRDLWSAGAQVQWVKDLPLSQLRLRSQLQLRSDPWPGNSICLQVAKKEKKNAFNTPNLSWTVIWNTQIRSWAPPQSARHQSSTGTQRAPGPGPRRCRPRGGLLISIK